MKVLVFTTLFPNPAEPLRGVFVKERIRHYTAADELNVVVPVSVFGKWKARLGGRPIPDVEVVEQGLTVHHPTYFYVPGWLKFLDGIFLFLSSWGRVWRIRRRFRFDLIDAHYCFPDGFAAVLLGRVFRVPVSVTLRGNDITLIPRFALRKPFVVYALKRADVLVAVSRWLGNEARKLLEGQKDIHVLMNSVDHAVFRPMDRIRARETWGVPREGKVVLSIGGMIERKGFHHLIRGFHEAASRSREDLHLLLAGGGGGERNFKPFLEKLVEELGLSDRVRFLGAVPHRDLVHLYNAADLFCLFSEREGCPNVLMEAIACGLPVVVAGDWADRTMVPSDDIGYIAPGREGRVLGEWILAALNRTWDREKIRGFSLANDWGQVAECAHDLFTRTVACR